LEIFRETWQQLRQSMKNESKSGDIHNELMKKYDPVPRWWFYTIIASMAILGIVNCQLFGQEFQLPTWAFLLSLAIPSIFILPLGIIEATNGTVSDNETIVLRFESGFRPLHRSFPHPNLDHRPRIGS